MTHYLLSIYQPDGPPGPPPPWVDLEQITRDLEVLNAEMRTAGVWVMAAGLVPPQRSTVVRFRDGEAITTDGPFAEATEHLGGFTVVDVPDDEHAQEWGRRLARATTLPVEIRAFQDQT